MLTLSVLHDRRRETILQSEMDGIISCKEINITTLLTIERYEIQKAFVKIKTNTCYVCNDYIVKYTLLKEMQAIEAKKTNNFVLGLKLTQ